MKLAVIWISMAYNILITLCSLYAGYLLFTELERREAFQRQDRLTEVQIKSVEIVHDIMALNNYMLLNGDGNSTQSNKFKAYIENYKRNIV